MSIMEMEQKLNDLQYKKINIAKKLENGKIDEESAQEMYEPISKEYNETYIALQRKREEVFQAQFSL